MNTTDIIDKATEEYESKGWKSKQFKIEESAIRGVLESMDSVLNGFIKAGADSIEVRLNRNEIEDGFRIFVIARRPSVGACIQKSS